MHNATEPWVPDKIWLEILENIPIAHAVGSRGLWRTFSSLSLTCRRLRRIALPAVYHSLTFHLKPENTQQGGLGAMRNVLHAEFRANCLAQCPHLLRHVREFTLESWDLKILGPPERGASDKLSSTMREDWWWAAYDVVTGLILQMPGLQKLSVLGSAITHRLDVSISYHRGLESLVLSSDNGYQYCDDSLDISKPPRMLYPEEEPPPSIRHLDLIGRHAWDESVDPPGYFDAVISDSLLQILSLRIYFPHIPADFSAIADLSALRSLSVELAGPDDYSDCSELCDLLESSPALYSLEFFSDYEWTTDVGLQDLPEAVLQKLEVVSGPPQIVMPLIPGRPVNTIRFKVRDNATEALGSFEIPASTAAQVHTFEPNVTVFSDNERDLVLQFSCRFVNLTCLKITYDFQAPRNLDDCDEAGPYDVEFIYKVVESISHLPRLLVCWVFDPDYLFTDYIDLPEATGGCPIGMARTPAARGHPSLKELLLFHEPIWRWYPGEGWTPQILPPEIRDL